MEDVEKIETELANMPMPVDFETLEEFASKVRERLADDYDSSPEEKRRVLELLHIRVYLGLDGSVRIDGWYDDEAAGESISCDRLSATTSIRRNH